MAKKPNAPAESAVPAVDPQKRYLMDQFGGLMEQVGEGFGGPLQEELIRRHRSCYSGLQVTGHR